MIEVLDKSHKAGDHFNREVSAVKLCVGLSGPSLFLNSVWVYGSHLIASSIPVELAGGELMQNFLLGCNFRRRAAVSGY